jgi:hypothetical protein
MVDNSGLLVLLHIERDTHLDRTLDFLLITPQLLAAQTAGSVLEEIQMHGQLLVAVSWRCFVEELSISWTFHSLLNF